MSWHIETIKNQYGSQVILLRQAWREGKRIRKKTIANLSKLRPDVFKDHRMQRRDGKATDSSFDIFTIHQYLPHGHVAAIVGTAQNLGFPSLLYGKKCRQRDLALGAICDRLISPKSNTFRFLGPNSVNSTLDRQFNLGKVSEHEVIDLLDWLLSRQKSTEKKLAKRHRQQRNVLLFALSSSFLKPGKSLAEKAGRERAQYGLICGLDGCPISIQILPRNATDACPLTENLRKSFGIDSVTLVGDSGMLIPKRIREDLVLLELDWITDLKRSQIRSLLKPPKTRRDGNPQGEVNEKPPLCPEDLVPDRVDVITSPDYPGERLIAGLDLQLRDEERRKRENLLQDTERQLQRIRKLVDKGSLKTWEKIDLRVDQSVNLKKVGKYFTITVSDNALGWTRKEERVREEARLDGIYVIRTNLKADVMSSDQVIRAYNSLAMVKPAFRAARSALRIQGRSPYREDHVRARIFMCMLAYYVQWNMRKRLAPILHDELDGAIAKRKSPFRRKSRPSNAAKAKTYSKTTPVGMPVYSFDSLLEDLATLDLILVSIKYKPNDIIPVMAAPTILQSSAFELLDVKPERMVK